MSGLIIIVRDDKLAGLLATACRDRGAETFRPLSPAQALSELGRPGDRAWSGLILDLSCAPQKPLDLVRDFLGAEPELKIVALGKNLDVKTLSALVRLGVTDFLELPPEPLELSKCLDNLLGRLGPAAPSGPSPGAAPAPEAPAGGRAIIGRAPALKKVFRLVDKVAATDSTVMIHGESGTGKELLARALHFQSPRASKPLIPVNCGAIPEELLEAELFGHEKGAFTNAIRTRLGRFEMADGGTIFLDEIGDMSPKLQVKLLRVIQEHEIERVGGDRLIAVDIRIITATNVDLARAVEEGRFREDLFYRLNVIPITMPPLRERLEDVPLLIEHFLARLRAGRGSPVTGLAREALDRLLAYGWPGNVRELENLIERMVTLAEGTVLTLDDLPAKILAATDGRPIPELDFHLALPLAPPLTDAPDEISAPAPAPPPDDDDEDLSLPENAESPAHLHPSPPQAPPSPAEDIEDLDLNALVAAYETRLITWALKAADGVKSQAAKRLNLNRTTLVEKMRKLGL
ncbi:MAG: sigma-54 dependent transcriptional regulator [Deltaproteobacteria bacterium]|nr:sigma-54 dependent transcriptional regulator [Deltaproteobacteria bacterium]